MRIIKIAGLIFAGIVVLLGVAVIAGLGYRAHSPFISFYTPFEKDFVFVQWDQPGAGKTYIRAGNHQPTLATDRMAADGIAITEYLKAELHKQKIILVGQDWGGLLGVRMIEQRPELFSAFVGTGQLVSMYGGQSAQYQTALSRATANHDPKMLDADSSFPCPGWG